MPFNIQNIQGSQHDQTKKQREPGTAGQPALRFDALDIAEDLVTFLWLGKPVFMVKRDQQQLVHLWGELPLTH